MRNFYAKLAWTGIRNNRRFYLPYILTCIGMVMMHYIIAFLTVSPSLSNVVGGSSMQIILEFGCWVIGIFAVIFLFYTNSFLTKRRKKEFGLYNILGMGKTSLSIILCWETVIVGVISVAAGLLAGIVLSKAADLVMVNMLLSEGDFTLSVPMQAVFRTIKLFALIFGLLLVNMLWQMWKSNPMELLHSEQTGEKPPKANWLFALAGVVILAAAYYLAVTIEEPMQAVLIFFLAVVMVIVATYLLFIAGSVAMCRLLQKNKNYYYKANHFVSVSSMGYRMKRNGASLASICILCTMVLVMIASTGCLYMGIEGVLRERYPRNVVLDISYDDFDVQRSDLAEEIRGMVQETTQEGGENAENALEYTYADLYGYWVPDKNKVVFGYGEETAYQIGTIWQIFVVSLDDYNRLSGSQETLAQGEALMYLSKTSYEDDTITIGEGEQERTWNIKKQVEKFVDNGVDVQQIYPSLFLVVPDVEDAVSAWIEEGEEQGKAFGMHWIYGIDIDCGDEKQTELYQDISERLQAISETAVNENGEPTHISYSCECAAAERALFYGLYGGLFFLGIMLGIVFILAAVLMMYYKQVSEGYEDQARFEIMQKVGMTSKQIKKSINSQMLTVFFLPLLAAVLHLAFAFPMINRMLILFGFANMKLLICVTGICVLVFAVFYTVVYRITSQAYYSIVKSA